MARKKRPHQNVMRETTAMEQIGGRSGIYRFQPEYEYAPTNTFGRDAQGNIIRKTKRVVPGSAFKRKRRT